MCRAVVISFSIAKHNGRLFDEAGTVAFSADDVFAIFGRSNEMGRDMSFLKHGKRDVFLFVGLLLDMDASQWAKTFFSAYRTVLTGFALDYLM